MLLKKLGKIMALGVKSGQSCVEQARSGDVWFRRLATVFLFCSIGLVCILYQTSLKRFTLNIKGFIATRTSKILLFLINQKKKVVVFLISIPTLKLIIHYFIYV